MPVGRQSGWLATVQSPDIVRFRRSGASPPPARNQPRIQGE
jgi:hypothetical protein